MRKGWTTDNPGRLGTRRGTPGLGRSPPEGTHRWFESAGSRTDRSGPTADCVPAPITHRSTDVVVRLNPLINIMGVSVTARMNKLFLAIQLAMLSVSWCGPAC